MGLSKTGYFTVISATDVVKSIMKREGILEKLNYKVNRVKEHEENREDIYDGEYYKREEESGIFAEPNANDVSLTLLWSTDGFSPYKSAKLEIWMFLQCINELPYEERYKPENLVVSGVWQGSHKPEFNLFLQKPKEELKRLRDGIEVELSTGEVKTVKAKTIGGTCDMGAKPPLLNMKQWNGSHGCPFCLQKGEYSDVSKTWVYPYQEGVPLRTDEDSILHALRAYLENKKDEFGVTGLTIMSQIVDAHITGTVVELMHNMYEGHLELLFKLLFSSKFAKQEFSLANQSSRINEYIGQLTPPNFIDRLPRSIELKSYWKAHDRKDWLHYYSMPILEQVMQEEYFECYKLLVYGISILNSNSISDEDLDKATKALKKYVELFEKLYGRDQMFLNTHSIQHLAVIVKRFGPLWVTSCFPFEDLYGMIIKWIHGSKDPQLQLTSALIAHHNLCQIEQEKVTGNDEAYELLRMLQSDYQQLKEHKIAESTYALGPYKIVSIDELPDAVRDSIVQLGILGIKYVYFHRLKLKRKLFYSTSYKRALKTNSTYAMLSDEQEHRIGVIQYFVRVLRCDCSNVCTCESETFAMLRACHCEPYFSVDLMGEREMDTGSDNSNPNMEMIRTTQRQLGIDDELKAVNVKFLKAVCFPIKVSEDLQFVVEPVNTVEKE